MNSCFMNCNKINTKKITRFKLTIQKSDFSYNLCYNYCLKRDNSFFLILKLKNCLSSNVLAQSIVDRMLFVMSEIKILLNLIHNSK